MDTENSRSTARIDSLQRGRSRCATRNQPGVRLRAGRPGRLPVIGLGRRHLVPKVALLVLIEAERPNDTTNDERVSRLPAPIGP